MTEFLLFRLYGPLAAWGEPAVGEYRPSARYPSKSAVLGLVAAALGIRRSEGDALSELFAGYGFAVRMDAPGSLLRDYHTVQTPPARRNRRFYTRRDELAWSDPYTLVSQRDYRVDAMWTVALWALHHVPQSLSAVSDALRAPRLTLYLGRKSCPPALPLAPALISAATLKEAFDGYPAIDGALPAAALVNKANREYHWDECDARFAGMPAALVSARRDLPLDKQRWQFGLRSEHSAAGLKEDN